LHHDGETFTEEEDSGLGRMRWGGLAELCEGGGWGERRGGERGEKYLTELICPKGLGPGGGGGGTSGGPKEMELVAVCQGGKGGDILTSVHVRIILAKGDGE